jgi:hypothetical protein
VVGSDIVGRTRAPDPATSPRPAPRPRPATTSRRPLWPRPHRGQAAPDAREPDQRLRIVPRWGLITRCS